MGHCREGIARTSGYASASSAVGINGAATMPGCSADLPGRGPLGRGGRIRAAGASALLCPGCSAARPATTTEALLDLGHRCRRDRGRPRTCITSLRLGLHSSAACMLLVEKARSPSNVEEGRAIRGGPPIAPASS